MIKLGKCGVCKKERTCKLILMMGHRGGLAIIKICAEDYQKLQTREGKKDIEDITLMKHG